jgi:hypothetical protein
MPQARSAHVHTHVHAPCAVGQAHLCLQQRIAVAAAACDAAALISSHVKVHAARRVGGAQPLQRCHQALDGLAALKEGR